MQEFERQVGVLVEKEYHVAAGLSEGEFRKEVERLKEGLSEVSGEEVDMDEGRLPFVIVIKSSLVLGEVMMGKVEREGKVGVVKLTPQVVEDFEVIEDVTLPEGEVYLLVDIDRGKQSLNVRPEDALKEMVAKGRSGLTIDEGIAIVTQYPDFLMKNNCFSLVASRVRGNQRVPAIWINGQKHPNLGWCWDRNPHTWLGSASCAGRWG